MSRSYRAKDNKRLHRIWTHMVERCENPNSSAYGRYGAKGVTICREWRTDFKAFCKWALGNGFDPKLDWRECTIDRINNNKGYSPDNCQWVSMKAQARNRSNNRIIKFRGKELTAIEWSEKLGIKKTTLLKRLNSGWSVSRALTAPINESKSHSPRNRQQTSEKGA